MRFVNEAQQTNGAGWDSKDLVMSLHEPKTHDCKCPRFYIIDAAVSCRFTPPCNTQVFQEMAVLQRKVWCETALKPVTQHVGQATMMITGKLK